MPLYILPEAISGRGGVGSKKEISLISLLNGIALMVLPAWLNVNMSNSLAVS